MDHEALFGLFDVGLLAIDGRDVIGESAIVIVFIVFFHDNDFAFFALSADFEFAAMLCLGVWLFLMNGLLSNDFLNRIIGVEKIVERNAIEFG